MSRTNKWRAEKVKIKAVFRLHFHATHIPLSGWDKLFISFIPADSGKVTAKTTKTAVRNGACKWSDPIYETTRLIQDGKTKIYDEKMYKLVVAMGSSRSSLLGEANINLADYADALKPYSVGLPLHGSASGTILHVTIQLLTSKTGFREFEQQRDRGLRTTGDQYSHESAVRKVLSSEETSVDQIDKVSAEAEFKSESEEIAPHQEESGSNAEYRDSAIGYDGSSNASDSLFTERQESSSTHEIESLKSTISGDLGAHSFDNSFQPEKGDPSDNQLRGWVSDYSLDHDLAVSHEENNRLKSSLEKTDSSIYELKLEVSSLQTRTNAIGTETQKFTEQIAAEVASGKELAREVSFLMSECSKFKNDLEQLTSLKLCSQLSSGETILASDDKSFQLLQFRWLNDLLVVEDKLRELRNKASLGFNESDFRSIHQDFEALFGFLNDFKQVAKQDISGLTLVPTKPAEVKNMREMDFHKRENFVSASGSDLMDMCEHSNAHLLKDRIVELMRELEESRAEQSNLTRKMHQMECYYEALIQELEENHKQILGELQNLRSEHSTCLYTISSAKSQMEAMHQDMNDQILRFAEDRKGWESLNKELEKRAITSEATLKRARLNYSISVDKLQKDLELLSFQVSSMFEANENLITQTYEEASQPCFQEHLGTAQGQYVGEPNAGELVKCQHHKTGVKKQPFGGDALLEDLKKSLHIQENLYKKVEEELCDMHVVNMHLDVFTKTLQECLLDAVADNAYMKEKILELAHQLELSSKSEELLMQRLQIAMDEVHSLNEYKSSCVVRCNDLDRQNQTKEAKLESTARENFSLRQRITEMEALVEECKSYESKFQACSIEKTELENLLKQESVVNDTLLNEISILEKDLNTAKTEFSRLTSVKGSLLKILSILQDKLGNLVASYDKKLNANGLWSNTSTQDMELEDFIGVVAQLEELQHSASRTIIQLMEEKKHLEEERDNAQASVNSIKSEILITKQKCEHDLQEMSNKFNTSNAVVQKLQLELEVFADKLRVRSEAEEKYLQQNTRLFADLAHLEVGLEEVASKNEDFAGEIALLETLTGELKGTKLTVAESKQENQVLMTTLQDKTEESVKLASELNNLMESLKCLEDELHAERGNRGKLESLVADLSSKLNEKHEQLLHMDRQNSELAHFKQFAADLELENSRVSRLLLLCEDRLQMVAEEAASVTYLESQLSEMHGLLIAADVNAIFIRLQCEALFKMLLQEFHSSNKRLGELQKQHIDLEDRLNHCNLVKEQCLEENAILLKNLEILRSDLDASVTENKILNDSKRATVADALEFKNHVAALEVSFLKDRNQHVSKVEMLKDMLISSEEENDNLVVATVELEIKAVVFEVKLDEQRTQLASMEEHSNNLVILQNQCNELTHKLSEQILKTEEFKKLSTYFKELKKKADEEFLQVREKRESEVPSVPVQDSLRIAFIKEQYETKLQELRHQLSLSKKHAEEMLWKLQDAADEIENRKKSEAFHLKKNEELSSKILELDSELHSVLSDKREIMKDYDWLRAETECSSLTLQCCKEEKQMLEAYLQECNEEKAKLAGEVKLMKELLDASTSPINAVKEANDESPEMEHRHRNLFNGDFSKQNSVTATSSDGSIKDMVCGNNSNGRLGRHAEGDGIINSIDADECSTANREEEHELLRLQSMQGTLEIKNACGASVDQENLRFANEHFNAQNLKSSMENLHKELERMIKDNSLFPEDGNLDPSLHGLQREFIRLDKANEELGSIFPLCREFPVSGNAVDRVLALEHELAEALQSKKKSSIFQSSFLKLHSDEEAIFQTFRDINELIRDMLKAKARKATVETELKEMHDRYSELSLRFAEVEGERQKLIMTIKNVRASKKP